LCAARKGSRRSSPAKTWAQVVAAHRTADVNRPYRVVALLDDRALCLLVACWDGLPRTTRSAEYPPPPTTLTDSWRWTWTDVAPTEPVMAAALGVDVATARRCFAKAVAAHLIYPDGTVNTWALRVVSALIVARVSGPRSIAEPTGSK